MNILLSAFACGPNWGSEISVGWNFCRYLSKYCNVDVITELGFKKDIEEYLSNNNYPNLKFYYIDIGKKGRDLFWKQGNWFFYIYYYMWQLRARDLAMRLMKENRYDILHHLNLVGFREPGFIWQLKKDNIKYVHGPVGGFAQFPISFIPELRLGHAIYEISRNAINKIQMRTHLRLRNALIKSDLVLASTSIDVEVIKKYYGIESILFGELGTDIFTADNIESKNTSEKLQIVWIGKYVPRKMLSIAIKAVGKAMEQEKLSFSIIGIENLFIPYVREMVIKYCNQDNVKIFPKIPNNEALSILSASDVLLVSSLQEGISAVVMEALSLGKPVICHDVCGMHDFLTDNCSIRIAVKSPEYSIEQFSKAIILLSKDRKFLNNLKIGARKRAEDLSWDNKIKKLLMLYESIVK